MPVSSMSVCLFSRDLSSITKTNKINPNLYERYTDQE